MAGGILGTRGEIRTVTDLVDLYDGSVDVVGILSPPGTDGVYGRQYLLRRGAADPRYAGHTGTIQTVQRRHVVRHQIRRTVLDVENEQRQLPLAGHGRVEKAKRAGGQVSRVCGRLFSGAFLLLVVRLEGGVRHVDLSAQLKIVRFEGKFLRRVFDHAGVGRAVIALEAAAARLRQVQGQYAGGVPAVAQRHAQAVDFMLHGESGVRMDGQHLADPVSDVLFRKDVLDGEHGNVVHDFSPALPVGFPAHALRRRIRGHPFRMFPLHPLQLLHEHVIFQIGDLRIVLVVVTVHVIRDLLLQSEILVHFYFWR